MSFATAITATTARARTDKNDWHRRRESNHYGSILYSVPKCLGFLLKDKLLNAFPWGIKISFHKRHQTCTHTHKQSHKHARTSTTMPTSASYCCCGHYHNFLFHNIFLSIPTNIAAMRWPPLHHSSASFNTTQESRVYSKWFANISCGNCISFSL